MSRREIRKPLFEQEEVQELVEQFIEEKKRQLLRQWKGKVQEEKENADV